MMLSGQRNECPTCKQLFNSFSAFDKHRAGSYGKTAADGKTLLPSERYCLNEEQMLAKKMNKNSQGFWITEIMPADLYL